MEFEGVIVNLRGIPRSALNCGEQKLLKLLNEFMVSGCRTLAMPYHTAITYYIY